MDVRRIMLSVHAREAQYVTERLRHSPMMAQMAAELLRDGSLEKMVRGETDLEVQVARRMLPARFRKWHHLPSPVALRVLQGIIGPENYEKVLTGLQQDENSEVEVALVKWALAVENDDRRVCASAIGAWRRPS